jgi:hypothetical protein
MVVRAIALSLALLIGGIVLIPLATDQAEAGPRTKKSKKRGWKGVKKYSKRWWQLYRAQERRKRLLAKKRRALRLRQLRLARVRTVQNTTPVAKKASVVSTTSASTAPAVLPSGDAAPAGWSPSLTSPAELQFRVDNSAGDQVGSASISVVGPANPNEAGSRKTLGGVSTTALRRDVIDRMIRENGWVVNDYQKEIAGQQVYVVVAQSQAKNGSLQSRMFYFTEVDGKIYNVATNTSIQESERLAEESEKVINSLKNRVRPVRASNP